MLAHVGALEFESDGRPLHVEYFLVEWTADASESEGRPLHWGTYDQTSARIVFENARELLAKANSLLDTSEREGFSRA